MHVVNQIVTTKGSTHRFTAIVVSHDIENILLAVVDMFPPYR
jgi:hypothetical protein